ncbi:histidinol-phosphate transaminase [Shewanella sp.]|uniref:pyridoxal phosphate-dependent aminotransferase n=1 Tax=Shewanella sp. TaxID=50422 RepID=UPI001A61B8F5|nr:histidinol-phosphate transaminase [Shewanella sp.]MBL4817151.1 histidinol-phosphate aminotransferase family protein [Shewanella sp.]MCJ8302065.1 histidinol-phosphate aminotransferase family protein [Shewanella sp.]
MLKLNYNENPTPPYSRFFDHNKQQVNQYNRYPSINGDELIEQLSRYHGFDVKQIVVGNGSVELISIISNLLALHSASESILPKSTFAAIPEIFKQNGLKTHLVPFDNWQIRLDDFLAFINSDTSLIYLDNPNNPTGSCHRLEEIQSFMNKVPDHITVIIDEAYIEFMSNHEQASSLNLISQYPNLIVTRTFSKAWGLAALRVGYAIGHPKRIKSIKEKRLPFSTNALGLETAQHLLECREQLEITRQRNMIVRQVLFDFFDNQDIQYLPSHTNFVAFKPNSDAWELFEHMQQNRVLLSPLAQCYMPGFLRITVGTMEEIKAFIQAYPAC